MIDSFRIKTPCLTEASAIWIALPLQKEPRDLGNSVFLDDQMVPYGDQWAFLSSVTRIGRTTIEDLVRDAERRGRVVGVRLPQMEEDDPEPWTAPPSRRRKEPPIAGDVSDALELVVANEIYIARDGLPPGLRNRLLRLGAFQNPEFYKAQAMRLPTFNKPRVIACGEERPDHIVLPRGCLAEVIELLKSHRIKPIVRDERFVGRPIEVEFSGRLRRFPQDAVDAFAQHDEGILCAPTAFGKTAVAAWLIASRKVNTLILVHRQQLLDQWHARLALFLGLPAESIGRIGGGAA